MKTKLDLLLAEYNVVREESPEMRCGQALFVAFVHLDPKRANEITGSDCDPFYDNSKIGLFLIKIFGPEVMRKCCVLEHL